MRAAHLYARFGWSVLPLHDVAAGPCSCGKPHLKSDGTPDGGAGKHPRISNWQHLASSNAGTVAGWQAEYPTANIGIATGAASGFFVLDVDGPQGMASLKALVAQYGPIPITATQRTGSGGWHFLFRIPDFQVSNSAGKLGPGLDVRGDGGQIVVAPSRSAKGLYEWFRPPFGMGPNKPAVPIAQAPEWLLAMLRPRATQAPIVDAPRRSFPPASPEVLEQVRAELEAHGPAVEGHGGDTHTWLAAAKAMHDHALTEAEAWPLLLEWNATCQPPWSEADLAAKMRGGSKYASGEYGSKRTLDALGQVRHELRLWREAGAQRENVEAVVKRAREIITTLKVDPTVRSLIETELIADTGLKSRALALPPAHVRAPAREMTPITGPAFACSATNEPLATMSNGVLALENMRAEIHYDEFLQRVLHAGRAWRDEQTSALTFQLQRDTGLRKIPSAIVHEAVLHYAHQHKTNVVTTWLRSLEWDGVRRCSSFAHRALGTEDNEYTRAVSTNFWRSLVVRPLKPGSKVDTMIVLEGKQGTGKSTVLKIIAGEWFAESVGSPSDKDFFLALTGNLLVEIGEMHTMGKSDVSLIKSTLTSVNDKYRAPYGRTVEEHPRQGIFAGTTNHDDWHRDDTGGRRFWPLATAKIDLEYVRANRDQLYAEAVADINAGEEWHHVPVQAAEREIDQRRQVDPWENILETHLGSDDTAQVSDLLTNALNMPPSQQTKADQMRIGTCLRIIGFKNVRRLVNGRQVRVWERVGVRLL